jgi:AcrR family transcriptional regulator
MARRRRGRPPGATAESHTQILDAVYELVQERSVRDLTIEAVAKRAGVGKPTIYKWWPSKADLVMAMFQERLDTGRPPIASTDEPIPVQESVRAIVRLVIKRFNGLFGKVIAELIAEGQSDPTVLKTLDERHLRDRRASTVGLIRRAQSTGELPADLDPEVFVDAIFGPLYYRLLIRNAPLTETYGDALVDQAFRNM